MRQNLISTGDYERNSFYSEKRSSNSAFWRFFQKYPHRHTGAFIRSELFPPFPCSLHTQPTLSRVTNAVFYPPQVCPSTNPVSRVYTDFKMSYTDPTVLKWSFWQVVGMAAYMQVGYTITSSKRSFPSGRLEVKVFFDYAISLPPYRCFCT